MNSYNKEAIFYLPGIFEYFLMYKSFMQVLEKNPHFLRENVKIGAFYDSPTCIWNGGRGIFNLTLSPIELKTIKQWAEGYQIPIRFTFTNCLLKEEHTYDTYGNMLLNIFDTGFNEIICNSDILEQYIRDKYKDNYKYISSTTKRLNNIDKQNDELQKNYYLVVLDYDFNFNFDYLKSIPNKEKCEILCNPVCVPQCPYRKKHYEELSKMQLYNIENVYKCPYQRDDKTFHQLAKKETIIRPEAINEYLDMGFKHFKLEGRATSPLNTLDILVYYLIKDEYQDEMRSLVHKTIW